MRGMEWDPRSGFRCGDCGGFEADLRADGFARCRTCGRLSVPRVPHPVAGLRRAFSRILAIFLATFVVEVVVAWIVAAGSPAVFRTIFVILAFGTGIAALLLGGIGAAPGRVAMGTQRFDRLGRLFMLQDAVEAGAFSTKSEARDAEEPGATGIFVLTGLGIALIFAAFVATVA